MQIYTVTHRMGGKRGRPALNEPCSICYKLDAEIKLNLFSCPSLAVGSLNSKRIISFFSKFS